MQPITALTAAISLADHPGVAVMSFASDGLDGPTDAAGAIVTGETMARASSQGLDPQRALQENDSYPLLDAVGGLIRSGPTGSNLNDLVVEMALLLAGSSTIPT